MLDLLIDALQFAIQMLYEKLVEVVGAHWENSSSSFNHGQLVIYLHHMVLEIEEWLASAGDDWPYVDADEYAENLFTCYDGEVMERAFSDSITSPLDKMWEIIEKAIELQELVNMLQAISISIPGGRAAGKGA